MPLLRFVNAAEMTAVANLSFHAGNFAERHDLRCQRVSGWDVSGARGIGPCDQSARELRSCGVETAQLHNKLVRRRLCAGAACHPVGRWGTRSLTDSRAIPRRGATGPRSSVLSSMGQSESGRLADGLLDDVVRQSLAELRLAPPAAADVLWEDFRQSVQKCLAFHATLMSHLGIRTSPQVVDRLRAGRHVQEVRESEGKFSYREVHSGGRILDDVVLARCCAAKRPDALNRFAELYQKRWQSAVEHLEPVRGQTFASGGVSLWFLFLDVSETSRRDRSYISDYDGKIGLYSYLWLITRSKYFDWCKSVMRIAPTVSVDAAGLPERSGTSWIEIADCYRRAATALTAAMHKDPEWLRLGEQLILYQMVFGSYEPRDISASLGVVPSTVTYYKTSLTVKLQQRFGPQAGRHGRDHHCVALWGRGEPQARDLAMVATTEADPEWVLKMRDILTRADLKGGLS